MVKRRMTKKALAVITAALTVSASVSIPVFAVTEDDVQGVWYINVVRYEGEEMSPAMIGMELCLELMEDGTVIDTADDMSGTWEVRDDSVMVVLDGEEMIFSYEDGNLITTVDTMEMVFGREQAEESQFDPGAVVEAPELEDFEGSWKLTTVDAFGMQLPASIAEVEMNMTIEGDKVMVHYDDGKNKVDAQMDAVLEGDTLTVTNPDADEDAFYMYVNIDSMNLRLHESGVLSYSDKDFSLSEEGETESSFEDETETGEYADEDYDFSFAFYFDPTDEEVVIAETETEAETEAETETESESETEIGTETEADPESEAETADDGEKGEPVELRFIGEIEVDYQYCIYGNTDLMYAEGDNGYYIMDKTGQKLTEDIYSSDIKYLYGYLIVNLAESSYNTYGVIRPDGTEVIPLEYNKIDIQSSDFAVAYCWDPVEDEEQEEYDEYRYVDGEEKHFMLREADVYSLTGDNKMQTFDRNHFEEAGANGHSINIKDRESEKIYTYDQNLEVISEDAFSVYDNKTSIMDYSEYDVDWKCGLQDIDGNVIVEPIYDYLSGIDDQYAEFSLDGKRYLYSLSGELISDGVYDKFITGYVHPRTSEVSSGIYESYGYFGVEDGGILKFINKEGEETCNTENERFSMNYYGLSAIREDENGVSYIYSADGYVTEAKEYSRINVLGSTTGLLVKIYDDNYNDGIMDWHGNVLIDLGSHYSMDVSGNGRYLYVQDGYGKPIQIYEIIYPGELAEEETIEEESTVEVTTEEAETEEKATEEETTEKAAEETTAAETVTEEATTVEVTTEAAATETAATEAETTVEAATEAATEADITENVRELLDEALMFLTCGPVSNQRYIAKDLQEAIDLCADKNPELSGKLQKLLDDLNEDPAHKGKDVRNELQLVYDELFM